MKLLAIGCNRGTIVFVNTDEMEKIYTRVTFHREAVTNIESVYVRERKEFYLISTCV